MTDLPGPEDVTIKEDVKHTEHQIQVMLGYEEKEPGETIEIEKEPVFAPRPERPWSPEDVRAWVDDRAKENSTRKATDKQRSFLRLLMDQFYQDDTKRHAVQKFLTGTGSTKDMTDPYVIALIDWIDPKKDTGGEFSFCEMAAKEAANIYETAIVSNGQMALI
jgi:hypothetical protein